MPFPQTGFGLDDGGGAAGDCGQEDGEEDLHEGVVRVVVGGPHAVDDFGEGIFVVAFFEDEGSVRTRHCGL